MSPETTSDLSLTIVVDAEASPGNVRRAIAALLLAIARREQSHEADGVALEERRPETPSAWV